MFMCPFPILRCPARIWHWAPNDTDGQSIQELVDESHDPSLIAAVRELDASTFAQAGQAVVRSLDGTEAAVRLPPGRASRAEFRAMAKKAHPQLTGLADGEFELMQMGHGDHTDPAANHSNAMVQQSFRVDRYATPEVCMSRVDCWDCCCFGACRQNDGRDIQRCCGSMYCHLPLLPTAYVLRHPVESLRYVPDTDGRDRSIAALVAASEHVAKPALEQVLNELEEKEGTVPIGVAGTPTEFAIVFNYHGNVNGAK